MRSRRSSWASHLAQTHLFRDAPADVIEALADRAVHRKYRKGTVVFVQGDPGGRCYVILTGTVKVSAFHADGREAFITALGPGELLGEFALFDDAPRSADAVVLEDAELLSLERDGVEDAMRAHPDVAIALVRLLARRLRVTNNALQDIVFFDVPGRVARRLADLADAYGVPEDAGTLIDLPLSQESLANMVGATRESVNKALAALIRRGLVQRRGRRYLVGDLDALRGRAR